jgi:hypothetical protein
MKKSVVLGLCLYLTAAFPAMALQEGRLPLGDLEVAADSLGAMVLGQSIELMTRDGSYASGKVVKASRETICLNVKRAEPKGWVSGSEALIQTDRIATVYTKRSGNVGAPIALGIAGGVLGFLGGTYVGYRLDSAPVCVFAGIGAAALGATGGAYAGSEAVRKRIAITVK